MLDLCESKMAQITIDRVRNDSLEMLLKIILCHPLAAKTVQVLYFQ